MAYVLTETYLIQDRKRLFGKISTPFFKKEVSVEVRTYGPFDTLKEAEEQACWESGETLMFVEKFLGGWFCPAAWEYDLTGRWRYCYDISEI